MNGGVPWPGSTWCCAWGPLSYLAPRQDRLVNPLAPGVLAPLMLPIPSAGGGNGSKPSLLALGRGQGEQAWRLRVLVSVCLSMQLPKSQRLLTATSVQELLLKEKLQRQEHE